MMTYHPPDVFPLSALLHLKMQLGLGPHAILLFEQVLIRVYRLKILWRLFWLSSWSGCEYTQSLCMWFWCTSAWCYQRLYLQSWAAWWNLGLSSLHLLAYHRRGLDFQHSYTRWTWWAICTFHLVLLRSILELQVSV